jgi:hypothetical protein
MSETFTKGHALLIGVGADLPNTVTDAQGIADILKDPSRCAYPTDQVTLLTEEQTQKQTVLQALEKLQATADEESTVVIYYSGHGYRVNSPTGEYFYLMTHGYNLRKLYETALSGQEFASQLEKLRAARVLLLLDCCHAGELGELQGIGMTKAPLPPEAEPLFSAGQGRVMVASSHANELSFAGKPYSAFTLALLEAFSGTGNSRKDGFVRVADLALHTRQVVPQRTRERQHPILTFTRADNFAIAYYAAGETEAKGLPFSVEEIEIEPTPGAWNGFNQAQQRVGGNQTNISGNVQGPVFSGTFHGSVQQSNGSSVLIAGQMVQTRADVVSGTESSIQRNPLEATFAEIDQKASALSPSLRNLVQQSLEQIKRFAIQMTNGEPSRETETELERILSGLREFTADIGDTLITQLANPAINAVEPLRNVAARLQHHD